MLLGFIIAFVVLFILFFVGIALASSAILAIAFVEFAREYFVWIIIFIVVLVAILKLLRKINVKF